MHNLWEIPCIVYYESYGSARVWQARYAIVTSTNVVAANVLKRPGYHSLDRLLAAGRF